MVSRLIEAKIHSMEPGMKQTENEGAVAHATSLPRSLSSAEAGSGNPPTWVPAFAGMTTFVVLDNRHFQSGIRNIVS